MSKKIMFNDKYGFTQAVLDGRKTMTRRIVPQSVIEKYSLMEDFTIIDDARYKVGEVIAIAQSYESIYNEKGLETMDMLVSRLKNHKGWQNKLFVAAGEMIHHIRITDVKVERLQDISDEDCIKEGVREVCVNNNWGNSASHWEFQVTYEDKLGRTKLLRGATPQEAYAALIDHISGKWTWDNNPYVFAYEFELID